jgi:hypothetical protein
MRFLNRFLAFPSPLLAPRAHATRSFCSRISLPFRLLIPLPPGTALASPPAPTHSTQSGFHKFPIGSAIDT